MKVKRIDYIGFRDKVLYHINCVMAFYVDSKSFKGFTYFSLLAHFNKSLVFFFNVLLIYEI